MEPRTTQEAWRRWRQAPTPQVQGKPVWDTLGRRWQIYTPEAYWTDPPADPLVLYVCFFGKSRTRTKEEVDPPEVGEQVALPGQILHLGVERSDRRFKHLIFEVRVESINDSGKTP